jgi:biotin carboxylase
LVSKVKKIAEKMKLVGVWNIQCIKQGHKYYFIDINNRFPSGSMPLAVACGMNIPEILIDILKGNKSIVELKYKVIGIRFYDTLFI